MTSSHRVAETLCTMKSVGFQYLLIVHFLAGVIIVCCYLRLLLVILNLSLLLLRTLKVCFSFLNFQFICYFLLNFTLFLLDIQFSDLTLFKN